MYSIKQPSKTNILLKQSRKLFHTADLATLWNISNTNTLYTTLKRYNAQNILHRIHKGFYSTVDLSEISSEELGAGYIHKYCYLSTESILERHGLISQASFYTTFVSSSSMRFELNGHDYLVRQMHDKFLYNDIGIEKQNNIRVASLERAIADILYYNPLYYFDGKEIIDWDRVKLIQKTIGYDAAKTI